MEEKLKCPQCKLRFQSTPKMLQCQHSLCDVPCLRDLIQRSKGTIRCPVCEEPHILGDEDNLPRPNKSLQRFQDFHSHLKTTIRATNLLATENQLSSAEYTSGFCNSCRCRPKTDYCFHCSRIVCQTCKEDHLNDVRDDILQFSTYLKPSCDRLKELQVKVSYSSDNEQFLKNGKLRKLFQTVMQLDMDLKPYLDSVQTELSCEKSNDDVLYSLLAQGEEYLVKLTEIESDPLLTDAEDCTNGYSTISEIQDDDTYLIPVASSKNYDKPQEGNRKDAMSPPLLPSEAREAAIQSDQCKANKSSSTTEQA